MSEDKINKGPALGARHLQALLLFFAITIAYAGRLDISIALVAMTDAETTNPNFREFDWNEKQKSYIISSFYWGYCITQFPGGYMARKLGVKITMLIAMTSMSLVCILIPLSVPWGGWKIYCALRTLQGLFQGLIFPCVHSHIATWSPTEERTRLGGLSHIGIELGTIVAMGATGMIAGSDLGWPGISYVYGGAGIIFSIIWTIFAENKPSEARFISEDERFYIMKSQSSANDGFKKAIPVPWKAIFTSIPFISLVTVRIGQGWGSTTMQGQIPTYLHGVLDMNIKSNALYSTLSYVTQLVLAVVFLVASDVILSKQLTSLSVLRKTTNTIAMWGPAVFLIAIGFLGKNHAVLAVIFMILNVGLNGGQTIGSLLNTIDLSPNHAGILMGILNTVANIIPIITPLAVGIIVYDETQRTLWQIIFIIAAALFFLGNLQYLFFGKTDTQPWDNEDFLLKHDCELNAEKKEAPVIRRADLNDVSKIKT